MIEFFSFLGKARRSLLLRQPVDAIMERLRGNIPVGRARRIVIEESLIQRLIHIVHWGPLRVGWHLPWPSLAARESGTLSSRKEAPVYQARWGQPG